MTETERLAQQLCAQFVAKGIDPFDALDAMMAIAAAQLVVLRHDTAISSKASRTLYGILTRYIEALTAIRDVPIDALDLPLPWMPERMQ